ncbi:hypothetical protein KSP40_PGU017641 [Platanthera guangdongensis]|uniref:Uncharacterized protein n=1 Tax=Platanthera guangdongensis TaxID=2320717 RepID=A0ABR2LJT6_9ASPA
MRRRVHFVMLMPDAFVPTGQRIAPETPLKSSKALIFPSIHLFNFDLISNWRADLCLEGPERRGLPPLPCLAFMVVNMLFISWKILNEEDSHHCLAHDEVEQFAIRKQTQMSDALKQENKRLSEQCSEYEDMEKQLLLKEQKLRSELKEAEETYKNLMASSDRWMGLRWKDR